MIKRQVLIIVAIIGVQANYIVNGGFQQPQLSPNQIVMSISPGVKMEGWVGVFDIFGSNFYNVFGSQSIQLATWVNGYVSQTVSLPQKGIYILTFEFYTIAETGLSKAKILWGNEIIGLVIGDKKKLYKKQIIIEVDEYVGELEFIEIGIDDIYGIIIDNVSLDKLAKENNSIGKTLVKILSSLSFISLRHIKGLKFVPFFLEDISMYFYDQRYYDGTMQKILLIVNKLEEIKRSFVQNYFKVHLNGSLIPSSSLVPYSNKKHMEVDDIDDNFIRGVFPFLMYGMLPMIAATLALCFVFKCIFNYKISIFLRRYFFVLPCLFQGLIEGNLQYFTYLFFRQSFLSFSFKFIDKCFIGIAVIFFFIILVTSVCFYFLLNKYLSKKSGYFIYNFYRTFPSIVYLTSRLITRGLLRGIIYCCFHNNYGVEIVCLCLVEILSILIILYLEKRSKIFMSQLIFVATLCYHILLLILNVVIFIEEEIKGEEDNLETQKLFLYFQEIIIYSLTGVILVEMIGEYIPNNKKINKQQTQGQKNREQGKKEKCNQEKVLQKCIMNPINNQGKKQNNIFDFETIDQESIPMPKHLQKDQTNQKKENKKRKQKKGLIVQYQIRIAEKQNKINQQKSKKLNQKADKTQWNAQKKVRSKQSAEKRGKKQCQRERKSKSKKKQKQQGIKQGKKAMKNTQQRYAKQGKKAMKSTQQRYAKQGKKAMKNTQQRYAKQGKKAMKNTQQRYEKLKQILDKLQK